jgi:hypothetical protein
MEQKSETTQQPPEKPQKKRSPAVYVAIGILIALVVVAFSFWAYANVPRLMSQPKPEITKLDGYGGFQNLNYVFYVDVSVKNNGGEGYVIVYAEISGAGKYEKQEQVVYLAKGQSKDLKFTFDVTLWGTLFSQITYRAYAIPQ